jgi:anthranilate synthase component 1
MKPDDFQQHAQSGCNRIPLIRKVLADLDTPLSTYLKLANQPGTFLFESVTGGDKWGRYSIIGLPCREMIRVSGNTITIERDGRIDSEQQVDDPLAWVGEYQQKFIVPQLPDLPRFTGGLVGYFGYETIRYIEPGLIDPGKPDPGQTPDIMLMVAEEVVVFDNLAGTLLIVVHVDPAMPDALARGQQRLLDIEDQLHRPPPFRSAYRAREIGEEHFASDFGREQFETAVQRIRDYITAGDCMQVVLSQRMSLKFGARPIDLYRALRMLNPSPYLFFLDLGDHQVVGSSPEILVRMEDDTVTVRPIAGTRPRGANAEEDEALAADLLADPKEIAEHVMLIDLGRNDAGRVAQTGSVQLTERMIVERYSHVMHIVSNVNARLKEGLSAIDVLRATFPAGTVSGAPKVRAMQIIDELEPTKRGVYSGAVGYLSWSGNMDTAIAIRTVVIRDGELTIQAGAGIVYDSVPASEWQETLNKARVVFRAAALAEAGLDSALNTESV